MLKKIGIAILGLIVGLLIVIALLPGAFRVTRSAQIAAPPAGVHALINDFHKWDGWSPWAKLDPNMKTTYSGAPAGSGASYHWTSQKDDVGEGRMTITKSVPAESVTINLEFIKPFASTSLTVFTIQPAAGGSTVEWAMSGENGFIERGFLLAMGGMAKAVGGDFEKGLAQMKTLAEKR
ncbi:MAG: polyketide cyclase [Bryobacterales bacterium]|nr:polyketide cyclase [Bryobacterales bacterium]